MKKLLFVCAGVGLAIGGGYLLYQAWKKYCQDEDSEDQDNNKVSNTETFPAGVQY